MARRAWRTALMLVVPLLPACAADNALLLRANAGCPAADQANAKTDYAAAALAYLKSHPGAHRVSDPQKELLFLCASADELQHKQARFQQRYAGVPVWGSQLIVHFDAQDRPGSVSGSITPIKQTIATKPKLDQASASQKAAAAAGEGWQARDSALYIYAHEGAPRLAHLVNVTKSLRRYMIFVDAETGAILNQISASPSLK